VCQSVGAGALALFVILRATGSYGDPRPWTGGNPLLFLNTAKYPASLQFLLMTLGPVIVVLPWIEHARGPIARVLEVFGRVPLFYYLLHIPLIHATALVVSLAREGRVNPWLFENHPMRSPLPPEGYTWSLSLMYLVVAVTVAVLYPVCQWYAVQRRPRERREPTAA
jgi:hypothetical protein